MNYSKRLIASIVFIMPLLFACSSNENPTTSIPSITSITTSITSSTSETTSVTSSTSEEPPEEVYDEEPDSLEGVDASDLSELYSAFTSLSSYKASIRSFFNDIGLRDYYRHYQKNYIQESVSLFDEEKTYSYTLMDEYKDVLNFGYLNKNDNYYSYSKRGTTVEERINNSIHDEDLTLVKSNAHYQEDVFSLFSLVPTYLESNAFSRISRNKYMISDKAELDKFVLICAPQLINNGYYMTFSKATIELAPKEGMKFRVRLYASVTQKGKIMESRLDEANKPNWYLLFSEAVIQ